MFLKDYCWKYIYNRKYKGEVETYIIHKSEHLK